MNCWQSVPGGPGRSTRLRRICTVRRPAAPQARVTRRSPADQSILQEKRDALIRGGSPCYQPGSARLPVGHHGSLRRSWLTFRLAVVWPRFSSTQCEGDEGCSRRFDHDLRGKKAAPRTTGGRLSGGSVSGVSLGCSQSLQGGRPLDVATVSVLCGDRPRLRRGRRPVSCTLSLL